MNISAKFENGLLTIQIPETWLSELKNTNWFDSHYVGEINDADAAANYLSKAVVKKSIDIGNGAEASPVELMLVDLLQIATWNDEKFIDEPEFEEYQIDEELCGDDQETDGE